MGLPVTPSDDDNTTNQKISQQQFRILITRRGHLATSLQLINRLHTLHTCVLLTNMLIEPDVWCRIQAKIWFAYSQLTNLQLQINKSILLDTPDVTPLTASKIGEEMRLRAQRTQRLCDVHVVKLNVIAEFAFSSVFRGPTRFKY